MEKIEATEVSVAMAQSDISPLARADDGYIMAIMGKKEQLVRRFGFLSILATSITLLASWEAVAGIFYAGLYNGGPVSLVYGMLLSFSGSLALASSLAEMASSTPIAGAQYHWTFTYAPKRSAAFLSWMQGWVTVFAWQATATSVNYLLAAQIQGLMVFNFSDSYTLQRWHGTLLMWAITLVILIINIWGIKLLPAIGVTVGICHVVFFVALVIPLLVLAPKSSPEFVFTTLINDQSGWTNPGITWCLGLLTVTWCFVGFDGAIHLSEEVRNSAITIPRILIWTIVINGVLAFGFVLVVLFCIGDVESAINSPTGFPIIEIFYQATGSKSAATLMMSCIIFIGFAASLALIASVSRLTWAFARDGGLPFSDFFSFVDPTYHIPARAIGLISAVIVLLSFINIGSSTAFNAIFSLSTVALYVSYIIPISCLVVKRFSGDDIAWGPWTLGRFGAAINIFALAYGVFICVLLPFPSQQPVTAVNMNYAAPVLGFVIIFAVGDWWVRGRKFYVGPRREVDVRLVNQPQGLSHVSNKHV